MVKTELFFVFCLTKNIFVHLIVAYNYVMPRSNNHCKSNFTMSMSLFDKH